MEDCVIGSILIANRGEIAVRLIRAYRDMGLSTVAVFSDADADAMHVRLADDSRRIGPAPVRESYLDIDAIVGAAIDSGVSAVDPGYGMLSENAAFAEAVVGAGLTFVGPSSEVIAKMGDKVSARAAAMRADVPVVPGSDGVLQAQDGAAVAAGLGYPVIVKSVFGGGGRGLRIVEAPDGLDAALRAAASESDAAFGRPEVFVERYVRGARHIEVQIVADGYGTVVHLGDRDCTVQRRQQKIIEEAPAAMLPPDARKAMTAAAVRLAVEVGYTSTGTVEFLFEPSSGQFYFLEMNTRLQVEHGITELVTGIDLAATRARIAAGEPLAFDQDDVRISGHAIHARLAAEDPTRNFAPTPGVVEALEVPAGPWVRTDLGVCAGDAVAREYDSMFGKILAWGEDRESARRRLVRALNEFRLSGFTTTARYCAQVLESAEFVQMEHTTTSVEDTWIPMADTRSSVVAARRPHAGAVSQSIATRHVEIATTSATHAVTIYGLTTAEPKSLHTKQIRRAGPEGPQVEPAADGLCAPMDGVIVAINAAAGDMVEAGDVIAVVEAMKMQMPVSARARGVVAEVLATVGMTVCSGQKLARWVDDASEPVTRGDQSRSERPRRMPGGHVIERQVN
jgi:acetyl-CoA/propionyl-CoA carboxylase biotin carboxyl carrier protein